MKKKGFLIYFLLLGFIFIPKMVFAETVSGTASVGRQSILDTSNNYYYTDWKLLSSNSLNSIPVGSIYSGNDFYLMGSEYSFPISLTGQTNFAVTVRVPVSANTIYTYQETDCLSQSDFRVGVSPNFAVYNITPTITSFNRAKGVYARNGVAHVYMYYDVVFNFTLSEALTGAYNLNFSVMNLSANRSAYYLSGGNSGVSLEFPVGYFSGQTEPDAVLFSMMSPTVSMSYGTTADNQDIIDANNENTQLIISNQNENTQDIIDSIDENYEKLVDSQEVCVDTDSSSVLVFDLIGRINGSGELVDTSSSFWRTTSAYTNGISNFKNTGSPNIVVSEYDSNKNYLGYYNLSTNQSKTLNPTNFYRFSSSSANSYVVSLNYCKNGNQAISDNIMDDSHESPNQFLEDMESLQLSDTPITDLLAMPLNMVRAFHSGISGQCSTIDLGSWYDKPLTIPCLDIPSYIGNTLWNVIDVLFSGFLIYNIAELMIHDFDSFSSADDLFDETYTPKHTYKPKHGKE